MSKELVISAASHERRVAILEEGQLVEIYIEREKEFALVGSIYKGKVTRVLPGMQSAFVDIGLDGDAFLYVSDVFENLEDYDHGHPQEHAPSSTASLPPSNGSPVEVLPGESLARASEHHEEAHHEEAHHEEFHHGETHVVDEPHTSDDDAPGVEGQPFEEHHESVPSASVEEQHAEAGEERQPDSNASAPQNFAPHYNPTQSYPARGGSDRPGQNYGRGGDRGGDRGRGGRWGRRGGRHRGGRPQGGPGGRNLPPSKYASPQGGESRGYDNRSGPPRSYDNRRPEAPRSSVPSVSSVPEEEIILPGESLAKYRGKSAAAPAPAPIVGHETHEEHPASAQETTPRATGNLPAAAASGGVPRRFSGGLPRWLLADAGAEAEAVPSGQSVDAAEESSAAGSPVVEPSHETSANSVEAVRNDVELNEDQVAALASGFVEAKHEETSEVAEADAIVGGAEFDEEETEEQADETEETIVAGVSELSEEEAEEVEAGRAANRAEFAADVAQEHAEHDATHGEHGHGEHEHGEHEHAEHEHVE